MPCRQAISGVRELAFIGGVGLYARKLGEGEIWDCSLEVAVRKFEADRGERVKLGYSCRCSSIRRRKSGVCEAIYDAFGGDDASVQLELCEMELTLGQRGDDIVEMAVRELEIYAGKGIGLADNLELQFCGKVETVRLVAGYGKFSWK